MFHIMSRETYSLSIILRIDGNTVFIPKNTLSWISNAAIAVLISLMGMTDTLRVAYQMEAATCSARHIADISFRLFYIRL